MKKFTITIEKSNSAIGANHANVDSGDILSIIRKGQSALNRLFS